MNFFTQLTKYVVTNVQLLLSLAQQLSALAASNVATNKRVDDVLSVIETLSKKIDLLPAEVKTIAESVAGSKLETTEAQLILESATTTEGTIATTADPTPVIVGSTDEPTIDTEVIEQAVTGDAE